MHHRLTGNFLISFPQHSTGSCAHAFSFTSCKQVANCASEVVLTRCAGLTIIRLFLNEWYPCTRCTCFTPNKQIAWLFTVGWWCGQCKALCCQQRCGAGADMCWCWGQSQRHGCASRRLRFPLLARPVQKVSVVLARFTGHLRLCAATKCYWIPEPERPP